MSKDITDLSASKVRGLQRPGFFKEFKKVKEIALIATAKQNLPINMYVNFFKKLSTEKSAQDYGFTLFQGSSNSIHGILTENNKPLKNVFVFLYQSSTGVLAARTLTEDEGKFTFKSIAPDVIYYIVASDPKGVYNTVTIDGIRLDSKKDYTFELG